MMTPVARLLRAFSIALAVFGASQPANAEIVRFHVVDSGKVLRGGQPETFTDLEFLKSKGVRTIINLKTTEDEVEWEREAAKLYGITVISRPTSPIFVPSDDEVDEIQSLLLDPALQPVYLHCRHGKDRTGLMMGIYRVEQQGWTPRQAYREMRTIGFNPWLLGLRHAFWSRVTKRDPSTFGLAARRGLTPALAHP